MTYIVHGATGAQGSPVLSLLSSAGYSVAAAVRSPAGLPADTAVKVVDYADPASLAEAYRGAEGVFVHLPLGAPDDRLAYARNIVEGVVRAQPARVVVSTSGALIDDPTSPLAEAEDSPIATLVRGLEDSASAVAVVAPRLYLENLLLPVVAQPVRANSELQYPLRTGFPVSWSSHLDVADAAVRLLTDSSFTGVVAIGQLPGLVGDDLAAGFSAHLGNEVRFESITPEQFGERITPLFGAVAASSVADHYRALGTQQANLINEQNSAQVILGLTPRTVPEWLEAVGF